MVKIHSQMDTSPTHSPSQWRRFLSLYLSQLLPTAKPTRRKLSPSIPISKSVVRSEVGNLVHITFRAYIRIGLICLTADLFLMLFGKRMKSWFYNSVEVKLDNDTTWPLKLMGKYIRRSWLLVRSNNHMHESTQNTSAITFDKANFPRQNNRWGDR